MRSFTRIFCNTWKYGTPNLPIFTKKCKWNQPRHQVTFLFKIFKFRVVSFQAFVKDSFETILHIYWIGSGKLPFEANILFGRRNWKRDITSSFTKAWLTVNVTLYLGFVRRAKDGGFGKVGYLFQRNLHHSFKRQSEWCQLCGNVHSVAIVGFQFEPYHVVALLSFSRNISLALFVILSIFSIFGWSDLLQILRL